MMIAVAREHPCQQKQVDIIFPAGGANDSFALPEIKQKPASVQKQAYINKQKNLLHMK